MELDIIELLQVPLATKQAIVEILGDLGVTEQEDLVHVKEEDLLPAVNKITARKLIASWSKIQKDDRPVSVSSTSESESSFSSTDVSWYSDFEVPWDRFPPGLLICCEEKRPPSGQDRRAMIRVLADAVTQIKSHPTKKALEWICHKIVNKYPKTFKDTIEGMNVGSGYDFLANRLTYRIENLRKGKSRRSSADMEQTVGKPNNRDEYGCVKWAPPLVSDAEEIEEKRTWLVAEWNKSNQNTAEVKRKMDATYAYQRQFINQNGSVASILSDWPFLFVEELMFDHYSSLIGQQNAKTSFLQRLESLVPKIYSKLEEKVKIQKLKLELMRKLLEININCTNAGSQMPKMNALVDLLCTYFGEPHDDIIIYVLQDQYTMQQFDGLPPHPVIVASGDSLYTATHFSVFVEQRRLYSTAVMAEALAFLFSTFYVLNIQYPAKCSHVYEFIQRYFAGINPDGSRGAKRRKGSVNPKVISFMQMICV